MVEFVSRKRTDQSMPTAFRVALRMLDSWCFSAAEAARALGLGLEETEKFRSEGLPVGEADDDLIIRVSLLLGIERALETLLANDEDMSRWVNGPSDAPPFQGRTPKSVMIDGTTNDLRLVRNYLDSWLPGDFT